MYACDKIRMPWTKDSLPPSVKKRDWTAAQIDTFVKTANAILEKTGNEGEAIATGIKQADGLEKANAAQWPRTYFARHMQPGVARYDNEDILVDTDAMKRMMPSGVGKPVYIEHQNVVLDTLKEDAAGYIIKSFYNELDGWAWFEILIIDDEAHECIANGWYVSNAYIPTEIAGGGTKINVPYKREFRNAEFTHLALVPNPRYEGAIILTPEKFKAYQDQKRLELTELQNSKTERKPMLKLFKQVRTPVAAEEADDDTMVELQNGKVMKFKEIINMAEAGMKKDESKKFDGDIEVVVNGKKMKASEVVAYVNAMCEKENEEGEDEKEKAKDNKKNKKPKKNETEKDIEEEEADNADEDMGDEDMENGDEEEEEKGNKKAKKNSKDSFDTDPKYFETMMNAHKRNVETSPKIESPQSGIIRGKERYGSGA